jgi:phage terminase small subunit
VPRTRTPLSHREAEFVRHFLAGKLGVRGNATQAYIAAGYAPRAASSCSAELLRKPRVHQALAAYCHRRDVTVDRWLEEVSTVGFARLADVAEYDPERGLVLKRDALDHGALESVEEIVDPAGMRRRKVRMRDKLGALTLMGKYLGVTHDRVEHTGKDGGPIEVALSAAERRVRVVRLMSRPALGSANGVNANGQAYAG